MADSDLDKLWAHVLAHWDEDAPHTAFLDACRARGALADAAARYREEVQRAEADPDHAERAESARRRLGAVVIVAVAEMEAARTPRAAPSMGRRVAEAILLGLIALAVYVLVTRMFGGSP